MTNHQDSLRGSAGLIPACGSLFSGVQRKALRPSISRRLRVLSTKGSPYGGGRLKGLGCQCVGSMSIASMLHSSESMDNMFKAHPVQQCHFLVVFYCTPHLIHGCTAIEGTFALIPNPWLRCNQRQDITISNNNPCIQSNEVFYFSSYC